MSSFQLNGVTYEVDEYGYLVDCMFLLSGDIKKGIWTNEVAKHIASVEGIVMTGEHWLLILFSRDYYEEYAGAPAIRYMTTYLGKKRGREKGNIRYLLYLFPDGLKQICKIAGLPRSSSSCGCC